MSLLNSIMKARIYAEGMFSSWIIDKISQYPEEVQLTRLMKIIRKNEKTGYGKAHSFEKIKSVEDFRKAVPINDYEDLRPWIEREDQTNELALTPETPLRYAVTSGTTGKPKFIPVLESTLKRQRLIQHLFVYKMLKAAPKLLDGKIFSIVSPAVEGYLSDSGRPFGSTSGHMYESIPRLIQRKYVIPPKIFSIEDYDVKYQAILRLAIQDRDITFVSTANPSTLARLAKLFRETGLQLINDLAMGIFSESEKLNFAQKKSLMSRLKADPHRASELKKIWDEKKGLVCLKDIWPEIQAVACWTGGSSGIFLDQIKNEFNSKTLIRDLGYLSSEFRGTIPFSDQTNAGLPTFRSHFLEFVERDTWDSGKETFLGLHELQHSKQYYIFVTSDFGLYRYDMNDIVEVDGFFNKVPLLKFIQKGKGVTNITGEKLYENQVLIAVDQIENKICLNSTFFMMLANEKLSRYEFFYEPFEEKLLLSHQRKEDLAKNLDHTLRELNIEYDVKRSSNRLHDINVTILKPGTFEAFKRHSVLKGQREGQFKIIALQYKKDLSFDFEKFKDSPLEDNILPFSEKNPEL
jgi:hypothetical protein